MSFLCIRYFNSGGDSLRTVLDMFSAMIQSGKDVFIDQNMKLKVYTFNPPNVVGAGQNLFFTSNMTEFLKKSKSVVEIKASLEGNMCFSYAFTLGLAQLKDGADRKGLYKKFLKHAQRPCGDKVWKDTAVALLTTILELNAQSFVTCRDEVLGTVLQSCDSCVQHFWCETTLHVSLFSYFGSEQSSVFPSNRSPHSLHFQHYWLASTLQ